MRSLHWGFSVLLFLSSTSWADEDEGCINELDQDLNCNFIDYSLEELVDMDDATCASTLDDEGEPFPNADWYYDYTSFGCEYPVAEFDVDGDGLGYGTITIGPEEAPDRVASLICDNCPELYNPRQ